AYPSPNGRGASWLIDVRELSPERQRIQLELFGDGIYGLVYDATVREIVPISLRLTGPGFVFAVLLVNVALWGSVLFAIQTLGRKAGRPGTTETARRPPRSSRRDFLSRIGLSAAGAALTNGTHVTARQPGDGFVDLRRPPDRVVVQTEAGDRALAPAG